jgi:hypothetical protein
MQRHAGKVACSLELFSDAFTSSKNRKYMIQNVLPTKAVFGYLVTREIIT